MQEGESELGGLKIPHGNTNPTTPTPGPQPDSSAAPVSEPAPSTISDPEPHSPLGSQPNSTVSPANPAPPQPSQPLAPSPAQVSPQPFQQFQSQQAQSPQPLQSSPQFSSPFPPRSISPGSTNPFTNTISPSSFPNTPNAVFPNTGDIVLSEPKPKGKIKKWVMIATASVVAIIFLVLSIAILSGNNPFQPEPTTEEYGEILNQAEEYSADTSQFNGFINSGIDEEISFYRLFLFNNTVIYNASLLFNNGTLGGSGVIPSFLEENDFSEIEGLNEYTAYLDSIQKLKVSSDIKNTAKEVSNLLPEYTEISQSFLNKFQNLRHLFYSGTSQELSDFITSQDFPSNIESTLLGYKAQYDLIVSTFNTCKEDLIAPNCLKSLDTNILTTMDEDTYTVAYIFNNFIGIDGQEFITEFDSADYNFINAIGDQYYDF